MGVGLREFGEGLLVVRMPAGERRPVLDDVARGPKNPPLVRLARHVVVGAEDVEVAPPIDVSMKSTTCSGVQAAAGFSVLDPLVMPVKVKPGMSRCALTRPPSVLRNSCASASVTTFTPAFETL